jgi:L-ascorbate metabolism protein UlaG (beta-lactamase superfamily)
MPSPNVENRLQRIHQSSHYQKGAFQNEEPTAVMLEGHFLKTLSQFLHKPKNTVPPRPLPSVKTDLKNLADEQLTVVWFGHSSYLMQYQGFTILVDPLLQSHASPVVLFGKPFPGTDIYHVDDLPEIDLLIITHDHYDHLAYHVIKQLQLKVKSICTSLGVGGVLESWGVPAEKITELDWDEGYQANQNLHITAQTARHFSGRTLRRNQTVWSAFVLQWFDKKIFIGGDSGYGKHFAKTGDQFGPFDLAFLECGQYGENWPQIHMQPEETAAAAIDLKVKVLMPVHWAKFTLALHPWDEPIKRLLASPQANRFEIATPKIGEPFYLGGNLPQQRWWENI